MARKRKQYRVTVYQAKDGWRWRMNPATGGNLVDASSEAFTRRSTAVQNAARTLGTPSKVGEWSEGRRGLVTIIGR